MVGWLSMLYETGNVSGRQQGMFIATPASMATWTGTPADRAAQITPWAVLQATATPSSRIQDISSNERLDPTVVVEIVITATPSPTPYILFRQTNVPILTAAPCSTWLMYGTPVPEECYFHYIGPEGLPSE